jgi:hypothetical protein
MKPMGDILKPILGAICGGIAYLAPIHPLIVLVFVFVGIDFITGVWASRKRAIAKSKEKAQREGVEWNKRMIVWAFSSERARSTVYKTVFYLVGISLTWALQVYALSFVNIYLEKIVAGFVLGVELFSFLENAAYISDHPVFRWLRNFTAKELKDKAGIDIEASKDKPTKSNRHDDE